MLKKVDQNYLFLKYVRILLGKQTNKEKNGLSFKNGNTKSLQLSVSLQLLNKHLSLLFHTVITNTVALNSSFHD